MVDGNILLGIRSRFAPETLENLQLLLIQSDQKMIITYGRLSPNVMFLFHVGGMKQKFRHICAIGSDG